MNLTNILIAFLNLNALKPVNIKRDNNYLQPPLPSSPPPLPPSRPPLPPSTLPPYRSSPLPVMQTPPTDEEMKAFNKCVDDMKNYEECGGKDITSDMITVDNMDNICEVLMSEKCQSLFQNGYSSIPSCKDVPSSLFERQSYLIPNDLLNIQYNSPIVNFYCGKGKNGEYCSLPFFSEDEKELEKICQNEPCIPYYIEFFDLVEENREVFLQSFSDNDITDEEYEMFLLFGKIVKTEECENGTFDLKRFMAENGYGDENDQEDEENENGGNGMKKTTIGVTALIVVFVLGSLPFIFMKKRNNKADLKNVEV